jgi:ribosomal protein L28
VLEAGSPFVGDIKTGGLTVGNDGQPSYWSKYPVQIAAYVDAVPYDTETDERWMWSQYITPIDRAAPPHAGIALIYHYDLARALAGEVVDWQAIPVNVQAGREGGDLCRAAADFAKRRDLFAMPAPTVDGSKRATLAEVRAHPTVGSPIDQIAAPVGPNPVVEQRTADPEPSTASTAVPGRAADEHAARVGVLRSATVDPRRKLIARIAELIDSYSEGERWLRHHWPEGVPTLKRDGHSDAQLQLILAAVRRVEAEVGAGWHPDDGPPPHVNTNPRAEVAYPTAAAVDEGGAVDDSMLNDIGARWNALRKMGMVLCQQIASEAHAAGRSISVSANPTRRRWSIARAVIAWAASGRSIDELWLAASNLATFEQCRDPSATLGGLISQFTIEQADRLYEAAG